MKSEIIFKTVDDFSAKMKELGVSKIALAKVGELRPYQAGEDELNMTTHNQVDLLGYSDGVLYKSVVIGDEAKDVESKLKAMDFDVTVSDRNLI